MAFRGRLMRSKHLLNKIGKLRSKLQGDHPTAFRRCEGRNDFTLAALTFFASFFVSRQKMKCPSGNRTFTE